MNLLLVYKNFAVNAHISHIGLGVSALNTAKVLKRHGLDVNVRAINMVSDLDTFLSQHPDITHVVISAAWIPALDLGNLVVKYPQIEFASNIHSNVGFLQADANGVDLLRRYVHLARELLNFRVGGNNLDFVDWLSEAYSTEAQYLPNLYDLDSTVMTNKPLYNGGTLRIGAFGASRPLKNFMTAAGAAISISKELRVPVEFWMNSGRPEGGGSIQRAIEALLRYQPNVSLHLLNWCAWPEFLGFHRNSASDDAGLLHRKLQHGNGRRDRTGCSFGGLGCDRLGTFPVDCTHGRFVGCGAGRSKPDYRSPRDCRRGSGSGTA